MGAAKTLDGRAISATIRGEIAEAAARLRQDRGVTPCLAAVLVGENPASEVYVRNKRIACEKAGLDSRLHRLPADVAEERLLRLVAELSADDSVHGVLVQLPLPPQIDTSKVLRAVSPAKDVDAFHPENVGLLVQGQPRFLPCTPAGVQQMLIRGGVPLAGRHAVVIGRSHIVGRPLSIMLSQPPKHPSGEGGNATVTLCHSRTADLSSITRQADVLIVAIGKARFLTADMVKPGAAVIDVGTNRGEDGRLVGDVDYGPVSQAAGWITPVPGGVGPMTITMLLFNTLAAARGLES